jgi:hypothetical protein
MMKSNTRIAVLLCAALCLAACTQPHSDLPERTLYDPDLYGWRSASWSPFTVLDTVSGIAYGRVGDQDRYVAVAATGVIAWSDDGDVWRRASADANSANPFSASFNAVCFGGGTFVAVGSRGRIAWSPDGKTWIAGPQSGITGFGAEDIRGIAYGMNTFVAVGGNANISRSADGQTWIECRDAAFGGSTLHSIAYDNEGRRFYIGGDDGKRGYSGNPASKIWNFTAPEADAPFHSNAIRKLTVGRYGDRVAVGVVFSEWGKKQITIATEAETFTGFDADIDDMLFRENVTDDNTWSKINDIAWGGGNFVAVGSSAKIGYWPSYDYSNNSERYWRAISFSDFKKWEITALAACNGRFFIGGIGGRIGYSK